MGPISSFLKNTFDFSHELSGVVLQTRLDDFDSIQSSKLSLGGLWRLSLTTFKSTLYRIIALNSLTILALIGTTFLALQILGKTNTLAESFLYLGLFLICNLLSISFEFFASKERCVLTAGLETLLSSKISQKILTAYSGKNSDLSTGNLKTILVSDIKQIAAFFEGAAKALLPATLSLLILTPVLYYFSGTPGLFGAAFCFLILPVSVVIAKAASHYDTLNQSFVDSQASVAGEWIKNIRLVRFLSWQSAIERDLMKNLKSLILNSTKKHFFVCITFGLSFTWWMLAVSVILASSVYLNKPLNYSSVFGSLWIITLLVRYLAHTPMVAIDYGAALVSMIRISSVLEKADIEDFYETEKDPDDGAEFTDKNRICLQNIHFSQGNKEIFVDFNLTIDMNEKLAVVGTVGSGKTTLLQILAGEIKPQRGQVLWQHDGQLKNIWTEAHHSTYRGKLAVTSQEPFVSNGSFLENIAFSEESDPQAVIASAYLAELEADLMRFPDAFKTEIGESGVNLSGGQKQRLSLARAFYSKRKFFIFDDPLSAVDSTTEIALAANILAHCDGCALSTHRLSEIHRFDRVIILEDGQVTEDGVPSDLRENPQSLLSLLLKNPPHNE